MPEEKEHRERKVPQCSKDREGPAQESKVHMPRKQRRWGTQAAGMHYFSIYSFSGTGHIIRQWGLESEAAGSEDRRDMKQP